MPNTLALAFKKQVPFLQKSSPRKEMDKVLFMCFPKTLNPWCNVFPLISGGKGALNRLRPLPPFNATFPPDIKGKTFT